MNREVHVRFYESLGLQCPGPLAKKLEHGRCVKTKKPKRKAKQ